MDSFIEGIHWFVASVLPQANLLFADPLILAPAVLALLGVIGMIVWYFRRHENKSVRISSETPRCNEVSPESLPFELQNALDSGFGTAHYDSRIQWRLVTTKEAAPILSEFNGHRGEVRGVRELGDGRILSWGDDKTIRIWSADGELTSTLNAHMHALGKVIVLNDGRLLSWSGDWMLRLWTTDGKPIRALAGHLGGVTGALELSDGRLLSWSADRTLRLWSAAGAPQAVLNGHDAELYHAIELPDGRLLSRAGDDTVRVWSKTGEPLSVIDHCGGYLTTPLTDTSILLTGHDDSLRLFVDRDKSCRTVAVKKGRVLVLSDGRCLAQTYSDSLNLWSGRGDICRVLENPGPNELRGAMGGIDGQIVSWCSDRTLRLWSTGGEPLEVVRDLDLAIVGVLVLADGRLVSWSEGNTLRVWSAQLKPLQVLNGHRQRVSDAIACADGSVLSWSRDGTLLKWSVEEEGHTPNLGHEDEVRNAIPISDGRLLSWSRDSALRLWSREGSVTCVLKGHPYVGGATELPDRRLLSWPQSAKGAPMLLWTSEGSLIRALEGHQGVNGAQMLKDGRILSWGNDSSLRIWTNGGDLITVLLGHELSSSGHTLNVNGALELDNGTLVSWSADNTIRLWSSEGKPQRVIHEHPHGVRGVRKLPGNRFVSWGHRSHVLLWTSTGDKIAALPEHSFDKVMVLSDGRILTFAGDSSLRLSAPDGRPLLRLEAGGQGSRTNEAVELPNGRILSWGSDGARLWSHDGKLLQPLPACRGAARIEDDRILLWNTDGAFLLLSSNGQPLSRWTCRRTPISAVVMSTDPSSFWCLSANDVMLVKLTLDQPDKIEIATTIPAPSTQVAGVLPSKLAAARAISTRAAAAVESERQWNVQGLASTTDATLLEDFAGLWQWSAPQWANKARQRLAALQRATAEPDFAEGIEAMAARNVAPEGKESVEQLLQAFMRFSGVSFDFRDPSLSLNDYGELACLPYRYQREIHDLLDKLTESEDADAFEKIEQTIIGRINDHHSYACLVGLCEALGRRGGDRSAVFLSRLLDLETNAWEYTRDMKRGAARGLAHLLARDGRGREYLTKIGDSYGYGRSINRILSIYKLQPIVTWDAIAESAVSDAREGTGWEISQLSDQLRPFTRAQRVKAFATAAMGFRDRGSRPKALQCYLAALQEEPQAEWIWRQIAAVLEQVPVNDRLRKGIDEATAGRAGGPEAMGNVIADIRALASTLN
jgi:WD40 repeat protein